MRVLLGALALCFVLAGIAIYQAGMYHSGPIALRDAAHMEEFLTGMSRRTFGIRVDGGPSLALTFAADGSFRADGVSGPGVVPRDASLPWINLPRQRFGLTPESFEFLNELFPANANDERVQFRSGVWSADTTMLTLTLEPTEGEDADASNGEAANPARLVLPLEWDDGRRGIGIGGIRLVQSSWRPHS